METVHYSIICEDVAHYFFVNRLLGFANGLISFQFNNDCYYKYRCSNKKQVENGYVDMSNQAFRLYEQTLDVLFIMLDYDIEPLSHNDYHDTLSKALFSKIKDKVIIAIPVRSIEHWLRYLQWKKENPISTKNEAMENENTAASKIKIYGSKKPSRERTSKMVDKFLDEANIPWLCQRSVSFNHFYKQIKNMIKM